MEPIHRRGFLGVVGAVLAGTSAAAAAPRSTTVAHVVGDVVDLDLGTVRWPSLSINTSIAGDSAHWTSSARPTLGQRVRVAVGEDAIFVGAIVRYTMHTDPHPGVGPYWEVDAESDELIAARRWLLRDEGRQR